MSNAKAARQQIEADYAKAVAAFSAAQSGHSWQTDVTLPKGAAPGEVAALAVWLSAPVRRSLRVPDLRAGDDFPLRTSFQHAVPGTCRRSWQL